MTGERRQKLDTVAAILHCKPHTVQVWLCKRVAHKVPTAANIAILKRELARTAATAVPAPE
jgi:hypothetical protein